MGFTQDDWNYTGDYDDRTPDEIRSDNITKARKWIGKKGFEVVRVGTPQKGEYFVNYEIGEDDQFYWFVTDHRKILQAEYTPLYGMNEMVTNFDDKYRYYIVKHRRPKKVKVERIQERREG